MKHGPTKCVWLFTYLEQGQQRGGEKWLPFYVWVWGEQDRDQHQMAAVRGAPGAQGTPPLRNLSLTETQTLHYPWFWSWIKSYPIDDCLSTLASPRWQWPPQVEQAAPADSFSSTTQLGGSWKINPGEPKEIWGVDDYTKRGRWLHHDCWLC